MENCLINITSDGTEIRSAIIGLYQDKLYRVEYTVQTNLNWETTFVEINSQHNNRRQTIKLNGDGQGNWLVDGKRDGRFDGCIDIDIQLTPFTNSLPIKRLKMFPGQEHKIKVLYIDLLEQQVKPVEQKYARLSDRTYHYENIPNDFEADIIVDESGFVVDYPLLFVRTFVEETNYR